MIICEFGQTLTVKTINRGYTMEAFGILGFVFGLSALAKVIMLEKQLKESGVLKEQEKSEKK